LVAQISGHGRFVVGINVRKERSELPSVTARTTRSTKKTILFDVYEKTRIAVIVIWATPAQLTAGPFQRFAEHLAADLFAGQFHAASPLGRCCCAISRISQMERVEQVIVAASFSPSSGRWRNSLGYCDASARHIVEPRGVPRSAILWSSCASCIRKSLLLHFRA